MCSRPHASRVFPTCHQHLSQWLDIFLYPQSWRVHVYGHADGFQGVSDQTMPAVCRNLLLRRHNATFPWASWLCCQSKMRFMPSSCADFQGPSNPRQPLWMIYPSGMITGVSGTKTAPLYSRQRKELPRLRSISTLVPQKDLFST